MSGKPQHTCSWSRQMRLTVIPLIQKWCRAGWRSRTAGHRTFGGPCRLHRQIRGHQRGGPRRGQRRGERGLGVRSGGLCVRSKGLRGAGSAAGAGAGPHQVPPIGDSLAGSTLSGKGGCSLWCHLTFCVRAFVWLLSVALSTGASCHWQHAAQRVELAVLAVHMHPPRAQRQSHVLQPARCRNAGPVRVRH